MYLSSKLSSSLQVRVLSAKKPYDLLSENYIFLLVQQGFITIQQENDIFRLQENDILLIRPNTLSSIRPNTENQLLILETSPSFLSPILINGGQITINSALEENKEPFRPLRLLMEQLALHYLQNGSKNQILSCVYLLLDELEQHFLPLLLAAPSAPGTQTDSRISTIRSFISQNYHLPVRLKDLADDMFLSEQYLSRFIRTNMKSSFSQLLNNCRIEHACQDLLHSNQAITEIAYNNGFSSITTFNRQFQKRFSVSPAIWRTENQPDMRISAAENLSDFIPDASGSITENITVSFAQATPFRPCWKDTINIGMFSNLLSHKYMQALTKCQEELGFSYVRFYNMFVSEIILGDSFRFDLLDIIFDRLMALRLKPFIELSFKPYKTTVFPDFQDMESLSFEREPSLEKEEKLLQVFLRHVVRRYGLDEVSSWRFEIWAKHDELLNFLETTTDYLHKFSRLRDVIHSIVPHAAIGGPGFNMAAPFAFFERYLSAMQLQKIRPDFISVYIYFYEPAPTDNIYAVTDFPMVPSDPDYLYRKFQSIQSLITNYYKDAPPLFVTEFNSSLYNDTYIISSAFQGAFLFRNMIRMTLDTPCLAYWHLSDYSNEPTTDPRYFIPGMGLLGRQQIPKPAWHVFNLLSWLCTSYASITDHSIATTDSTRHYQFAICNYAHYHATYCFTHQKQPSLTETYDSFEEKDVLHLSITMKDLPDGMYTFRSIRIGRSSGSFLDQLISIYKQIDEIGANPEEILINVDPYELSYYRERAVPERFCRYEHIQNGTFSARIDLDPHDVLLIDLKQKLL